MPSSFHYSSSAYISYKIEARVVTGAFRFDHTASMPIIISRLISIGNWATPIQQVKQMQVGCLCCVAGDVEFVVKLPRTGYCVTNSDVIPLTVDVQNDSTKTIKMEAKIIKKVRMFVRGYENVMSETVAEISSEPIQPHTSYVWNPANWIVPAVPTTLLGSRILQVNYMLNVSAIIPGDLDLSCDISLLMGNLPNVRSGNLQLQRTLLGTIVTVIALTRTSAASKHQGGEDKDNNSKNE